MIPQAYGQGKANPEGAPKEPAGLTIARAVIGTGVEKSEPVAAAETFPASTEQVYCFVEAKDIGQDAEITLVWIYGSKEMLKTALPLKKGAEMEDLCLQEFERVKRRLESRSQGRRRECPEGSQIQGRVVRTGFPYRS